ncbi:MAG TPA: thiamine-phosphate kinase [Pyrinomonadaceae bacterium]|nr:thiamine-phosphate kinase [Pyrinomonadaceae bacterium]
MNSEFEFINHIKERFSASRIGDDCAVLSKDESTDQLITADLLVEDIDFRLEWTSPQLLGHKALAVSLSDIAAMGGTPEWAMTSIGVPERVWNSDFLDQFYDGWGKLASRFGVELIGGDVSRTPDKIVVDSIVGGEVEKGKAVLRSGARSGDAIYITGYLGGAAGGLSLLEAGFTFADSSGGRQELIASQLRPTPQVETGRIVCERGVATAMIDISDGLSSDLAHICEASSSGAEIERSLIPIDPNLSLLLLGSEEIIDLALNGGEDFQLLFTANAEKDLELLVPTARRIGTVTASVGLIQLVDRGTRVDLPSKGFRHF